MFNIIDVYELLAELDYPYRLIVSPKDFTVLVTRFGAKNLLMSSSGPYLRVLGCLITPKPSISRQDLVDLSEKSLQDVIDER